MKKLSIGLLMTMTMITIWISPQDEPMGDWDPPVWCAIGMASPPNETHDTVVCGGSFADKYGIDARKVTVWEGEYVDVEVTDENGNTSIASILEWTMLHERLIPEDLPPWPLDENGDMILNGGYTTFQFNVPREGCRIFLITYDRIPNSVWNPGADNEWERVATFGPTQVCAGAPARELLPVPSFGF